MNPITIQKLKRDWLAMENQGLMQRRRRRYLHFDPVIFTVTQSLLHRITNPVLVSRHGFFPLIRRSQKNRLYKRDPVSGIKKITNKVRPISYAAHIDALIYAWYAYVLSFLYEKKIATYKLGESVIAYRKLRKSNLDFAKEVTDFIRTQNESATLAFDVAGFYDTLDFSILKKLWAEVLEVKELPVDHYKIYRSVTKYAYVEWEAMCELLNIGSRDTSKMRLFLNIDLIQQLRDNNKVIQNGDKGIPQGTPISCVLSNIYMLPFDIALKKEVERVGGMYRRYSDDILIVCTKNSVTTLEGFVQSRMKAARLEIEPSKTECRFFAKDLSGNLSCLDENGKSAKLQYLGVEFDGEVHSLRHKGRAKFERKMTHGIRKEVRIADKKKRSISKKKIYEKFSPLGEMNYISYARRAAGQLRSSSIVRSLTRHGVMKRIKEKISKETCGVNQPKI